MCARSELHARVHGRLQAMCDLRQRSYLMSKMTRSGVTVCSSPTPNSMDSHRKSKALVTQLILLACTTPHDFSDLVSARKLSSSQNHLLLSIQGSTTAVMLSTGYNVNKDQVAAASIRNSSLSCRRRLEECLASPDLMALDEWPRKRLADFNLWASGSGALSEKMSLDVRLAEKPNVHAVVLNLLLLLEAIVKKLRDQGSVHFQKCTPVSLQ